MLGGTATAAHAQNAIKAGTISLGGEIGFSRNTENLEFKSNRGGAGNSTFTTEGRGSTFRFSPAVGYFIADNLAIGLNLSYTAANDKITNTGPGTTNPVSLDSRTTLRVGPYAQYYSMLSDQFGLVGTLGLGYQSSFTPIARNSGGGAFTVIERKGAGFYAGIIPGVIFFPIPKFGISASIGGLDYGKMNIKFSDDADGESRSESNLGLNFGLSSLQFGGTFFLGR